ncbi:RWD domain-containing protein 1 [Eumeta japonica]|uniref:RWD domain-containing protein 1 n=1 Tax=Eumeta variegata TaxID=151549 RepID=A0A4C1XK23_EUMVA|nr:RWD domain-containing protein 1 [Eumeta japonica]
MDYQYEQASEIEALDSIYCGDMDVIETEPFPRFRIPIKSEGFEDEQGLACTLTFTYTSKYPEESPIIEVDNVENFDENDANALLTHLKQQDQNVKDEYEERLKDRLGEMKQYECLELDKLWKVTDNVTVTEYMIDDGNESEITIDEIMKALKCMKVGKAAGYDRVTSEMLRGGGGVVTSLLYQPFNKC